jgi:hypothetical protein
MTRQELIHALEKDLGVTLSDGSRPTEFYARSSNGSVLFTISLFEDKEGWHFGGTGALLSEQWRRFCREEFK